MEKLTYTVNCSLCVNINLCCFNGVASPLSYLLTFAFKSSTFGMIACAIIKPGIQITFVHNVQRSAGGLKGR